MADGKKSIVVYADWITKFEVLTDDEAGKLIKHFFRYVNDLNPKAPDRITELSFIDIEQCLKRDLVKWEKRAERSRENGKMGGRPSNEENPEKPKETQQVIYEPRKPVNVNVNGNVSVNDIKNNNTVGSPSSHPTDGTLNDADKCRLFVKAFNSKKKNGDKLGEYQSTSKVCSALKNRLKTYTSKQLLLVLDEALKDDLVERKYITPEYILREVTIERYLNGQKEISTTKSKNYIP